MSTKSRDWSVGNTATIGMSPYEISRGSLILTSKKGQEARWVEDFEEVRNRPALKEEPEIPQAEEELSIETGPPREEELIAEISP